MSLVVGTGSLLHTAFALSLYFGRFEEIAHRFCNLLNVGFECEVSCVNVLNHGFRNIPLKGFCAGRYEEGIILTPDCEEGRLMGPEILVEFGIDRHIVAIVKMQIELNVDVPGALDERNVEGVALWRDPVWFGHAREVLKANSARTRAR